MLTGAIFCFMVPGLLTLWLLSGMSYAYLEPQVCFLNLLDKPVHWKHANPLPESSMESDFFSQGLHKALLAEVSTSHWWQTNLPAHLPPASVLGRQADLCTYLDKWPTPGLTFSPDPAQDPMLDIEQTDEDLM